MATPIPVEKTLFASAARTASANGDDQINSGGHRGIVITIDATAEVDTASVVFTLQRKDATSGKYTTILASSAVEATGTTVMRVYPGLTDQTDPDGAGFDAVPNVANDVLPAIWRLITTHADADSLTYSVGCCLIP